MTVNRVQRPFWVLCALGVCGVVVSTTQLLAEDCNQNGVPDDCELAALTAEAPVDPAFLEGCEDCNQNGTPDGDEVARGASPDANANSIPDECEAAYDYVLGFGGPQVVQARAGSIARIPVDCELRIGASESAVLGWSIAIVPEGCRIASVTTRGTPAAPAPDGLFDGGFRRTGTLPARGRQRRCAARPLRRDPDLLLLVPGRGRAPVTLRRRLDRRRQGGHLGRDLDLVQTLRRQRSALGPRLARLRRGSHSGCAHLRGVWGVRVAR